MNRLEERIHGSLHAAAVLLPEETTVRAVAAEPPVSRWRGPAVAVAALVAVFVVLGGSLLLVTNLGGGGGELASPGVVPERFPVPEYVPADTELVYGNYAVMDPDSPASVGAVIARTTDEGFENAVVVTVYDSPDLGIVGPGERIDVGEHAAVVVENENGVQMSWVQDEKTVYIYAARGSREDTLAIAAAVNATGAEPFGSSALSIGDLPDGYSTFAQPRLLSTESRPDVTIEGPPISEPATIRFVSIEVWLDSIEYGIGPSGYGNALEVRGHDGYRTENDTGVGIWWVESPGVTVSVFGNYPESELLAIAEGLEFESETEWRRRYSSEGPEAPSTTTTEVTATSEEPAAVGTDGIGPDAPTTTATNPGG